MNNPVPLTEDVVLRPDVDFNARRELAGGRAARRRAGVRPHPTGGSPSCARSWRWPLTARPASPAPSHRHGAALRRGGSARGSSWHLDDLACAVALAVERELDGVYNVAPDGNVAGAVRARVFSGATPRPQLPDRMADVLNSLRWRFQRGPIPPGLSSYTRAPWLVANDRLRAEGWHPTVTNEQAYVEGTEAKWW